MGKKYTSNYIKNLVTQSLATITGLLSLFIVVPYLSSDKVLYGIYSVCISLTIFFNYADLGLQAAGLKYSAEEYAKNNLHGEVRIVGFTTFILSSFCLLISLALLPLVFKPEWLITDLVGQNAIASHLILILLLSTPFMVLKRVCSIVFSVRIEQYKYNLVVLVAQLTKILSILYFFKDGDYRIVEYYLFTQTVDAISSLLLFAYIVIRYKYKDFYKTIKFDREIWNLVKDMAFVSLFSSVSWILFYELDLMVLAKLSGPSVVAIYSTAFTLLTLSRNFFGIIYASFSTRYNHFVGEGNYEVLKSFFLKNVIVIFPIVFFPVVIFIITADPFVTSWAGSEYRQSSSLAKILMAGSLLAAFSYPSSQYLLSVNKIKSLYIIAAILPVIFWGGVSLTFSYIGVLSFAIFKSASQLLSAGYGFIMACKYQSINIGTMLIKLLKQYSIPLLALIFASVGVVNIMQPDKSPMSLVVNILLLVSVYVVSMLMCIITSGDVRGYLRSIIKL